ncbi:MAG: YgjV family protein [Clostridia bacterium]|nr:YgjV family protein [Clostridia bacterium]
MDPIFVTGQILGIVAIGLGFLSYQMKTPGQIALVQALTAFVFVIHYLMLGAITGMAMNIVCFIRGIVYYFRNKKGSSERITPVIFAVIMAGMGILTWNAWYSVFIFLGQIISTLCMAFKNPQNIRKGILVTSPMVIVYDVFTLSIGGIVYESVAITSSLIGIVRNRKSLK